MSQDINFLPNASHGDSSESPALKPAPRPLDYTKPQAVPSIPADATTKLSGEQSSGSIKLVSTPDQAFDNLVKKSPPINSLNQSTIQKAPPSNSLVSGVNNEPKSANLLGKQNSFTPEPSTNKLPSKSGLLVTKPAVTPTETTSALDVNLIPITSRKDQNDSFSWLAVILAGLISVFIVIGGYLWLRLKPVGSKAVLVELKKEAEAIQQQLNEAGQVSEDLLAIDKRLKFLGDIDKARVAWAPVFKLLEDNTLQNVSYSNLVADVNGHLIVSAEAPNLTEVGRQLKSWQTAVGVRAVVLGGLEFKQNETDVKSSGFTFTLTITVSPELLSFIQKSS